jgi:AcrR family transcriptional regulator
MAGAITAANDEGPALTGPRAAREAERRETFMRVAAAVFRRQGLSGATMEQIAAAAGVTKMVLYRRFASKDALILAIFAEVIRRLKLGDARPWRGYGDGMRKSLEAARSFQDGFLLLVRQGAHHPGLPGQPPVRCASARPSASGACSGIRTVRRRRPNGRPCWTCRWSR